MRALIASLLLLLVAAPAAAEKTYSAQRFDARLRILPDGAMEVVETIVFRFESGTFQHVFRELSRRRTDGIEIVSAEMDGRALAFGKESGQVEVRNGSKLRVEWRFAPRTDSTNTFVLTYIVRGVVQRQAGRDVLEWVALPTEHDYRILESEVVLALPATPVVRPTVDSKRVAEVVLEPVGERVQILARGVGRNGWLRTRFEFEEGAVIAAAPAWQQRQIAARAVAPRWIAAAGIVLAGGLMFMFGLRQGYDSPHGAGATSGTVETPPDTLRPAVAGALASNGTVTLQHAMATLFALADRGVVTITEEPRKWGQRNFTLQRRQSNAALAPEDTAVLNLAFQHKGQTQDTVPLPQARNRVLRRLRDFKTAVDQELRSLGMLDGERMRVRDAVPGICHYLPHPRGAPRRPGDFPDAAVRRLAPDGSRRRRRSRHRRLHLLRRADASFERGSPPRRALARIPKASEGSRARTRPHDGGLSVPSAAVRGCTRPRRGVVEVRQEPPHWQSAMVPRAGRGG